VKSDRPITVSHRGADSTITGAQRGAVVVAVDCSELAARKSEDADSDNSWRRTNRTVGSMAWLLRDDWTVMDVKPISQLRFDYDTTMSRRIQLRQK